MRRALLAIALLAGLAVVAPAAATQHSSDGNITIPLPGMNSDAIKAVTIKGKATGPVIAKTLNHAKLGNESIVYVVRAPKTGSGTFTIYALIKRFANDRRVESAKDGDTIQIHLTDFNGAVGGNFKLTDETSDCKLLSTVNTSFEGATSFSDHDGRHWALMSGRPLSEQGSKPEEVLDQVDLDVWGSCPGKPETWDSGPK
jgi:hypothetical protein